MPESAFSGDNPVGCSIYAIKVEAFSPEFLMNAVKEEAFSPELSIMAIKMKAFCCYEDFAESRRLW